ncbi:hypothetical protein DPMN_164217 [Dreissena polymorpha]|uniref:Uncharacterized protein n=1 Tax=Dreissena polymorpha TaxID=45954 RepID=A0A9D4ETA3_DREPO|nr:hypothetical protein DPMN_164217 [Dreissena polymorpha]
MDHINNRKSCLVMESDIVPLQTVGGSSQICRVEVRDTVKIPAHSRMWVPVHFPLAEYMAPLVFVEPDLDGMAEKNLSQSSNDFILAPANLSLRTRNNIVLHV